MQSKFCVRLKKTIQSLAQLSQHQQTENLNSTIGIRPTDLDTIGASWLNDLLFHLIQRPISKHLFSQTEHFSDLDWRQGYVAGYSHNPHVGAHTQRHRLVPHTDDSEVTLNVALCSGSGDGDGGEEGRLIGDETDFDGGNLVFWGLRGSKGEGKLNGCIQPSIGRALLHSGRHLHEVTKVTSGERFVIVVWARSWGSVRNGVCPCCWLNRRRSSYARDNDNGENSCICSPRWN